LPAYGPVNKNSPYQYQQKESASFSQILGPLPFFFQSYKIDFRGIIGIAEAEFLQFIIGHLLVLVL
jgi:hypothetical protein